MGLITGWQPGYPSLFGREDEIELIEGFVAGLQHRGSVLILTGEAGVGKTVLLDLAAEEAGAQGVHVLRGGGVEFEAEVSFLSLNQVLLPVRGQIDDLPARHRDALLVALGLGDGPAPDRLRICNAALAVLDEAARRMPILLVVDDLPWLDRASAGVLSFVARALGQSRIGFVGAARLEESSFFERLGLPEHQIRPLDAAAAEALMRERFPTLAGSVRRRLLSEGEGIPLALLELAEGLSARQRSNLDPLPAALPPSRRLQSLFAARVVELPKPTMDLLLLAVLDGSGDLRVMQAAGSRLGGLDHLEPAERARLITVEESAHRLVFRHPLIRSAVIDLSTSAERRKIHRVLAAVAPERSVRRAWHLAEATVGPDEAVACLLEEGAREVLRRGDPVGAVHALIRAADLSPAVADRSRRLATGAYIGADVTGELRNARLLLDDARSGDPSSESSLEAGVAAATVMLADGDVDDGYRLLVAAIDAVIDQDGVSDAMMIEALHTLHLICVFRGQAEGWPPFFEFLERTRATIPTALRFAAETHPDPAKIDRSALAELDRVIAVLDEQTDPAQVVRLALTTIYLDRLPACAPALLRVVEDAGTGGAVAASMTARTLLGFSDYWCGRWDQGLERLGEVTDMAESQGYGLNSWPARLGQGLIAAARGDFETAQARADEIAEWASARGARGMLNYAAHIRTLTAQSQGDFEAAFAAASTISPAGVLTSSRSHALWVTLHLVEAAVRSERIADASAHVQAMREADLASLSSRFALVAGAAEAMVAPGPEAGVLFERAMGLPGAELWVFDHARVQLAFGEYLRRNRASRHARTQLLGALEAFNRLGAEPWAARAEAELAATAAHRSQAADPDAPLLTPQELEIARLAAQGLTNREIGARLYLSHRTVSTHLYRIFPKLEITSRAALRDALTTLETATTD
ncbi:MAG: ATP-binding protein [Solirubrobacteraceae bacterium]